MNTIANSKLKKNIRGNSFYFILWFYYHEYYYITVNVRFLLEVFHVFILTRATLTELERLREWSTNLWLQLERFKMTVLKHKVWHTLRFEYGGD